MFVSLSQQTEKMGERMNSAMNHRRGGVLRKMIGGTVPVISGFAARLVREPLTSKNFQFSQGKIALLWDFLYIFAAELAI